MLYTLVLVGRVIGSVRVRAQIVNEDVVYWTRNIDTPAATIYIHVYTTVINYSGQHFKGPLGLAVRSLLDPASKDPESLSRCLSFADPCRANHLSTPLLLGMPLVA